MTKFMCDDIIAEQIKRESIARIHAINEQIERTMWLNYYLNLYQLPQLDAAFCEQTCRRYCPDFTPETARELFNRENKKLAEMQEADKASR